MKTVAVLFLILCIILFVSAGKFFLDAKGPGVYPPRKMLMKRAAAFASGGGILLVIALLLFYFF